MLHRCETKDTIWDLKKRIGRREHLDPASLIIKLNHSQDPLDDKQMVKDLNGIIYATIPENETKGERVNVNHTIQSIEDLALFVGPASNFKSYLLKSNQKANLELWIGRMPVLALLSKKRKVALIDEYDDRRQMYRSIQYFVKSNWTVQVDLEVKGSIKRLVLNKVEKDGSLTELEGIMKNYYSSKAEPNANVNKGAIQSSLNALKSVNND